MSFAKPPVVASGIALLAALSVVPTQGWARDGRRGRDVVYEMPPMTADDSREIIYVMPPMKPVKGVAAQAQKPAPKPAEQPSPAIAASPAPAKEVAPAQAAPAPVADAPRAEGQPAAEAPAQAAPQTADQAPVEGPAVAEQAGPDQPASADASPGAPTGAAQPPTEAQAIGEEPKAAEAETSSEAPVLAEGQAADGAEAPAEAPVTAEAPKVVEPAPIGPPIMTLNPPRRALTALKEPITALDARPVHPENAADAPTLAPHLQSTAPAPEQSPATAATEQPAPSAEEAAPVEAQAQALAPAGADVPEADADARIAALLAEVVVGPAEVRIADRATMWLPAGRAFIPLEPARKLAKEAGLEWRAGVQGVVAPAGGKLQWLAPVELLDDGYVKAGEPDALQPEKLLAAFEASLPEVNAQRARVGQPPVALGGWLAPPALTDKHRLSACVDVATQNDQNGLDRFFNCEAWALGRRGAIKVGLADAGEEAERLKGEALALADAIVFDRGETYEEFDAATDRIAPYVAADMLTRDVAARPGAPTTAPETESGGSVVDIVLRLLEPALVGAAALGLYVWLKRRRRGEKDATPKTAPASVEEKRPAAAGLAAPSLFERFLPTLHARFAKRNARETARGPAEKVVPAPSASAAPAPKAEPVKEKPASAVGGLLARFSRLRSGAAKAVVKSSPAPVSPANDAEEPLSALKKLAARMRGASEEPAAAVNVSRALRPIRTLPGAAPAMAEKLPEPVVAEPIMAVAREEPELIEPAAAERKPVESQRAAPAPEKPAVATSTPAKEAAPAKQPVFDDDDFGLVEPGDAEAASAAINAARALREARG